VLLLVLGILIAGFTITEMKNGLNASMAEAAAFLGATRETGQEAELEIIENSMIMNNTSIGEALLESKIADDPPTKYLCVLYGDPAFNPYEP